MIAPRVFLARIKRKLLKKKHYHNSDYVSFWIKNALKEKDVQIIQIGSNDGKTGDPLFDLIQMNPNWHGLFVEPVPYLFERLKKNYGENARFKFENAAVNNGDQLTFYWVDPQAKNHLKLPNWFEQLGSFSRQHIVGQLTEVVEPYIISQSIQGISLHNLFAKHGITSVDLLHIDTEGYDWEILSQFDLEEYSPSFILFEINHLSKRDLNEAIVKLAELYEIFKAGIDAFAVRKSLLSQEALTEIHLQFSTLR